MPSRRRMPTNSCHDQKVPVDEYGHPVTHIDGLEYHRNFLSQQEQDQLLRLIDSYPWTHVIARRQQFYGEVYYHTSHKLKDLQPTTITTTTTTATVTAKDGSTDPTRKDVIVLDNDDDDDDVVDDEKRPRCDVSGGICLYQSGMMEWLERTRPYFECSGLSTLPTQVLVNEYRNNLGIASHFEDVHAFGPIVVTISLLNPIYMTLKRPINKMAGNACNEYHDVVKILLEPGSLLIMKGDARYEYRHGIGKGKWVTIPPNHCGDGDGMDCCHGRVVAPMTRRIRRDESYRRVSLTIRHLLDTRRRVHEEEDELDTIKDPNVY